jgi:hypothetical protein
MSLDLDSVKMVTVWAYVQTATRILSLAGESVNIYVSRMLQLAEDW